MFWQILYTKFHKRLGSLLARKRNISYSEAISFLRRRLRFSILRTSLIALRGFRGNKPEVPTTIREDTDIDLIRTAQMHFWEDFTQAIYKCKWTAQHSKTLMSQWWVLDSKESRKKEERRVADLDKLFLKWNKILEFHSLLF